MAVSFSEIMQVKTFLSQMHITVSEEWVEACITFLKQEQPYTASQNLKKSVHEQWLVADLEEIACPSLPQELPTTQKITLDGNFALQVQGIRDVSRPAYSQLKQLTNSINSNEEFSSAPKAAVPEWEAKPSRMLMLNLTDGCIQVQGMEYRSINFLSPNLSPGIKVLIKGPVECRFGVLLLTAENISILGGEVESKLQQFSRENILREQLQIETDDSSQVQSASDNNNQDSSNNFDVSNTASSTNIVNQNQINISSSYQNNLPAANLRNESSTEDILDHFESDDDDFAENIDYGVLDEIENSQRQAKESFNSRVVDECDIWQEDEDMVRDIMEFQDANSEFKMPFEVNDASTSSRGRNCDSNSANEVFTYLSTVTNNPSSNCVITVKAFVITVLSKLECTPSKGWNLTVKINDGTATVNASIHDKVLENIIGVSAQTMMKKQVEASKNMEIRKEVMQTISKFKLTLQNYNCLMDVKFTPGEKPCIIKCSPVTKLHIQQLLERVRSRF